MTNRAISSIDGRYAGQTVELRDYFSEWALMKYRVNIEVEWLIAQSEGAWADPVRNLTGEEKTILRGLVTGFDDTSLAKIKEIEKITNHDVKAVENYLREVLGETSMADLIEFIHFGCTSEDINNLAYALMLRDGITGVWLPEAEGLLELVTQAAETYRDIPFMARTHGQAASPTTVGKELAVFVYRWRRQLKAVKNLEYLGKFNGAVGNYNAHLVAYPDAPWEDISADFIETLGLTWNPLTTQIESHDYMAECFHALNRFNNILLDFDRDMWLYISYGYFKQLVVSGEVGSSTMPHKVNPINFENSEANIGMSNAILSHLADKLQVSRLQRDLSDSSALRNVGSGIAHSCIAISNAVKGFKRVDVNREVIDAELADSWELLSEAVQTVMRKNGYSEPYETLKAFTRGKDISEEMLRDFIKGLEIPEADKSRLLALTPAAYTGLASKLVERLKQT